MLLYVAMHTQLLPYQKNSAALFDHFVHLPFAVFIDSAGTGRFDIISADPSHIIHSAHCENIFEEIKLHIEKLNLIHAKPPYELPFTIGAIGYFSYDIARRCETIPVIAEKDIALPEAIIGIYDWSIVIDHEQEKTYFTSILGDKKSNEILALLKIKKDTALFCITKPFQSNMSKTQYQNAFDTIKKHIFDGDCYQVNLAQRFSSMYKGDPWNAYQTLRIKNPAPYSAFLKLESGAILSTSPERFISVNNNIVETKPIKGTTKRYADEKKDSESAEKLLNSAKDHAENVMIVDLLRNDLSRTCIAGSVLVPKLCALESFKNVHHLVSTITGLLKENYNAMDLLQQCFPGGSITGAPKISAMNIIESLEPHRRSVYCGSIFYMDARGHMDSNIAIRTVICDENNIHCYAGGGIVYDSVCESEYEECIAKVGNILKILESLHE